MDSPAAKDEGRRGRRPIASRPDPMRIKALRARTIAEGKTVATLANEIGEGVENVYKVLSGTRAAASGTGHRIAVKLGLKDAPAPAGTSRHDMEPAR